MTRPMLREDVIAEAVPLWLEAHAAITQHRASKTDKGRNYALASVDEVLRSHGIRGRTFAELALYAAYERAVRERAQDAIGKVRRSA